MKSLQDQTAPQLKLLKDAIDSAQKLKDQLSCSLDVLIKEFKDSTSKHTESAQILKDQLSSTIISSVKELKDSAPAAAPPSSKTNTRTDDRDRRNNVILFGLEEKSLLDTRKDVENILEFLCGRAVPFKDAFRLGRFKNHDDDHPPRPLLVKLSSTWDKRLILAAKRNLKDYTIKRLFIREDLSPEVRKQRAQQRKVSSNPHSVSHSHSSSESSSGGNVNL